MMSLALKNTTIDKYFSFLKRFDNMTKKRLIAKLSESVNKETEEKSSIDLLSLYGAWEDSRSSDEIINDIRNSRIEKRKSIDL